MDVQFIKNRHILHDNPDLSFDVIIVRRHLPPHNPDAAPVIFQKGKHAVDCRRLPRAVRSEKSEYLSLFYFQVKMIQCNYIAVPFYKIFYLYHVNFLLLLSYNARIQHALTFL